MSGKLYHRIKKNGKWTWKACKHSLINPDIKCDLCTGKWNYVTKEGQ